MDGARFVFFRLPFIFSFFKGGSGQVGQSDRFVCTMGLCVCCFLLCSYYGIIF